MSESAQASKASIRNAGPIFFSRDRQKTLDYYHRLGFRCQYGMGFVEREGLEFIVHETAGESQIAPNYPAHGENALDVFCMVEGVEALYREFCAKQARIHWEIRTSEFQMREFAIMDPDGHTIGFGEPV